MYKTQIVLGRQPTGKTPKAGTGPDFVVSADDKTISRQHAKITCYDHHTDDPSMFKLECLCKNPATKLLVNKTLVETGTKHSLHSGDIIEIGAIRLSFQRASSGPPPPRPPPPPEIETGPDRKRQLIELLMIVGTCASPWLELCSIAALGLALGAGVSGTDDEHVLPSAVAIAHCLPATSLCCTITALAKHGDSEGTQDKLIYGFMGVLIVAILALCLAFPQTLWLVAIGVLVLALTAATREGLSYERESGTDAYLIGCVCLAVCTLCGLIGAGIMFKADGSDAQCTAYYDGFYYHDCNSTLDPSVTGVGSHTENISSNASLRVANASNSTLEG